MRTCQSILGIILAIAFVSCQSAPQSPVGRVPQSRAPMAYAPETSPGSLLEESQSKIQPSTEGSPTGQKGEKESVSKSVSIGSGTPEKKKSPIKPVIAPVQTGLLSPSTQEVPSGSPTNGQKEKQRIVLNFEKADIAEVTSQIFSDQLKLNYVMDQTLQGRMSMYIEGDFDNEELLQMVIRAYEANGLSVIPKKGFYFVQLSQKTTGSGLPVANPQLLENEKGTRPLVVIYRLRFMDPKQTTNLITPFITPGRKIMSDPLTNSLIFVEDSDNARVLVNLIKTIDINVLQEVSMEIVPLNSIAPQDAVQGMESLMSKLGGFKESALKNSLALLPLANFGGVLVMAQNPELLKSARQWLQALDVRGTGNQQEIYVYFVQNGLARDIAQIVSSVLGIAGAGGMGQQIVPSGTRRGGGLGGAGMGGLGGGGTLGGAGGLGGSSLGGAGGLGGSTGGGGLGGGSLGGSSFGSMSGTGSTMGSSGGISGSSYGSSTSRGTSGTGFMGAGAAGTTGANKPPGGIFTGEVMMMPDEVNNAIVVRANAVDYGKIKKAIETLDILPRAVLIEVMVAEVDLTKEFSYGLQYFLQKQGGGFGLSFGGLGPGGTVSGSTTTSTTPYPPVLSTLSGAGVAMSWVANAQNVAVLLSLIASKTNVTVLATPTLLATDNTEASLTVGGQTPIPTGSYAPIGTTTTGTEAFSTIEYAETGVILDIIPHINAGGLVRLELQMTVRNTGSNATVGAANTAPTFTERDIKTTLLAQDSRTVVIGGIINSSNTAIKGGIPWLQDIPLLSPLFSARSNELIRTELLVAITPHVIDQRTSQAPAELIQKMQNLRQRMGN